MFLNAEIEHVPRFKHSKRKLGKFGQDFVVEILAKIGNADWENRKYFMW